MIKEGSILEGPYWPEPIEVKIIEDFGEHIHIIGSTINSNDTVDHLLTKEEFTNLNDNMGGTGSGREILLDFSAPASEVFLSLEAQKYKFASMFDPFLAMNTSKIDPLPFQLDAVYLHVLKNPKIRFMIADDPGAGKTIMAGLIIKELKLRGLARRILIVTPGHLKYQWQQISGPQIDIINSNTNNPSFIAPEVTKISPVEIILIVNDKANNSDSTTTSIEIHP